jgi:hypothetical protein
VSDPGHLQQRPGVDRPTSDPEWGSQDSFIRADGWESDNPRSPPVKWRENGTRMGDLVLPSARDIKKLFLFSREGRNPNHTTVTKSGVAAGPAD